MEHSSQTAKCVRIFLKIRIRLISKPETTYCVNFCKQCLQIHNRSTATTCLSTSGCPWVEQKRFSLFAVGMHVNLMVNPVGMSIDNDVVRTPFGNPDSNLGVVRHRNVSAFVRDRRVITGTRCYCADAFKSLCEVFFAFEIVISEYTDNITVQVSQRFYRTKRSEVACVYDEANANLVEECNNSFNYRNVVVCQPLHRVSFWILSTMRLQRQATYE